MGRNRKGRVSDSTSRKRPAATDLRELEGANRAVGKGEERGRGALRLFHRREERAVLRSPMSGGTAPSTALRSALSCSFDALARANAVRLKSSLAGDAAPGLPGPQEREHFAREHCVAFAPTLREHRSQATAWRRDVRRMPENPTGEITFDVVRSIRRRGVALRREDDGQPAPSGPRPPGRATTAAAAPEEAFPRHSSQPPVRSGTQGASAASATKRAGPAPATDLSPATPAAAATGARIPSGAPALSAIPTPPGIPPPGAHVDAGHGGEGGTSAVQSVTPAATPAATASSPMSASASMSTSALKSAPASAPSEAAPAPAESQAGPQ